MLDRRVFILTEKRPEPGDPISPDDMIRIDDIVNVLQVGDVAADDDRCPGLMPAHQFAHPDDLADIRNDGADADDIVGIVRDFLDKAVLGRKIQQGARGIDIGLDQHQPEAAMKHAKGKCTLNAGHLILIKLHRVDFPAAECVVLGIGPKTLDKRTLALFSSGCVVAMMCLLVCVSIYFVGDTILAQNACEG